MGGGAGRPLRNTDEKNNCALFVIILEVGSTSFDNHPLLPAVYGVPDSAHWPIIRHRCNSPKRLLLEFPTCSFVPSCRCCHESSIPSSTRDTETEATPTYNRVFTFSFPRRRGEREIHGHLPGRSSPGWIFIVQLPNC
uniref:Uncharacterized protein n=1 Tax=Nelumbo nucifera TaxID=4432 RepID=A0A822ZIC8_NELNU|nr:TPA_asm: hypothetical protein HUJ06_003122 [Nelumbo nucifera]